MTRAISSLIVMAMTVSMVTASWVPDKRHNKRAESTTTTTKKTTTTNKTTTTKKTSTTKKTTTTKATTTTTKANAIATQGSSTFSFVSSTSTTTITITPTSTLASSSAKTSTSSSNTGAIVGGIIAAIAVVIMGAAVFLVVRRKKKAKQRTRQLKPDPFTMGFGSHDPPPPPQQNYNYQFSPNTSHKETSTFDQYEVTPISSQQTQSLGLYKVVATYTPTLGDEIVVDIGDQVELLVEYDDGWCQGINVSKNHAKGVFPRHCISNGSETATLDYERAKRVSSMMYR